MSYLANTSDPGIDATWFATGFVEGPEWSGGTYGVGHEGLPPGAEGLLSTEISGPVSSIYTRTTFNVSDASSASNSSARPANARKSARHWLSISMAAVA